MEKVRVVTDTLIEKIRENKIKHMKDYEETKELYLKRMEKGLEEALQSLKEDRKVNLRLITFLSEPKEYSKDYDRALAMFEMSVDEHVELPEDDFQKYVMDDWSWKDNFTASNQFYNVH